jgi:uncharacterized protein YecT (DUF1311 family)
MMSYQDNDCPDCTEQRMCPTHEMEMLDCEVDRDMKRIEELKKEQKNAENK